MFKNKKAFRLNGIVADMAKSKVIGIAILSSNQRTDNTFCLFDSCKDCGCDHDNPCSCDHECRKDCSCDDACRCEMHPGYGF